MEDYQTCLTKYGVENTYDLPEGVYEAEILPYAPLLHGVREAFADPDSGIAPSLMDIDPEKIEDFYSACEARLDSLKMCIRDRYLVRDRERLIWELDHAEAEVCEIPPDPILEKLHGWLDAEWTGTATELVQVLNLEMKPNAFTRYLNVNTGRLENEYGIVYQNARTHSGRVVTLKRIQPSP